MKGVGVVKSIWNLSSIEHFPTIYIRITRFQVRNLEASGPKIAIFEDLPVINGCGQKMAQGVVRLIWNEH